MKKKILLTSFITLIFLFLSPVFHASAASAVSVQGTALVINTGGEIDFTGHNSNVVVDPATGDISGYAWSEDIGWIDFRNNGDADPVKIDLDIGTVSGSAYVINTGGKIDFTNYNSNTKVDLESGAMSGYGWSEDIGWINFTGVNISGTLIDFTGVNISGTLIETGENIFPVAISAIVLMAVFMFAAANRWKKIEGMGG